MTFPVQLEWVRREPPLAPAAVAATGAALAPLREATVARLPSQDLRAVAGDDWLVVLGNDLPWADGAIYLGWDSGVLVPTVSMPRPPVSLLRAALPTAELMVLLPERLLLSEAPLRPADPALLGH